MKFSYTIAYAHGEDFTVENTITLHMLQEEGIYAIEYSDDMLLEGLYHRLPHRPLHPQGKAGEIFSGQDGRCRQFYSDTVAIAVSQS